MAESGVGGIRQPLENLGKASADFIEEFGYYLALIFEGFYWIVVGPFKRQPVRFSVAMSQMVEIGIAALPIVFILSFAIGVMLAIQGVHTLKQFGAETQVVLGIALSVTREFGPLITGILVAGRTGSALAARVGTMQVNQEVDALRVMGINPVRYLVSPVLIAMLVMMPLITLFSDLAAMFGGAVYCNLDLGLGYVAYWDQGTAFITPNDVLQGLFKSLVFAVIITLIGVSNGFSVTGGAEGVGRATTRAVVLAISYLVLADMTFTYFLNR
jgi:phospholipid/cholesterol/gamma-HCH transport system permease protein